MLADTQTAMPGIGISIPVVVERPAQPYLALRAEGRMHDLPVFAPPKFADLHDAMRQRAIHAGDGFFRYRRFTADGGVELDVGTCTQQDEDGRGDIFCDKLPAGRYAFATYRGPYDRLYDAFAMLEGWIETRGLAPAGSAGEPECQVEIYRISPAQTRDPLQWETDLLLKLAE